MTPAEAGWRAGVGALRGADPREMTDADLIVVWAAIPVSTQVNAMTHIAAARKRGAKLAVVDVYRTPTMAQADVALVINPGDRRGALALAILHVLLRDGYADREYLSAFTDFDANVEAHIAARTPEWAAAITGLDAKAITGFARLIGRTPRRSLRPGFRLHAVAQWRSRDACGDVHSGRDKAPGGNRGGGGFSSTGSVQIGASTHLGACSRPADPETRVLDQSRIAPF